MIKVKGWATLRVYVEFEADDLDEFDIDNMTDREIKEMADESVDWKEACRDAELDDFDVDEVVEIGTTKGDGNPNDQNQ